MALGQTNITTALIRNAIGAASNAIGSLCQHVNINKWSKYKPVRGAYPMAAAGNYGLDLANNWGYLKPRGIVYTEPYRMGDFRGYEHNQANTIPPAYVRYSDSCFAQTLTFDPINYPSLHGTLRFNSALATEITLANIGLQNYYFGVYVTQPAHTEYWWKTLGVVAANNQIIQGSVAMNEVPGMFDDFPQLAQDGSAINLQFILSSVAKTTWSSSAPAIWFRLPHETVNGIDIRSSYNISFGLYIALNDTATQFDDFAGDNVRQYVGVTTNINAMTHVAGWHIKSKPSWLDVDVWNYTDNRIETAPYYGTENLQLRFIPNATNYGMVRNGNIILADGNDNELATLPVSQGAGAVQVYVVSSEFTLTDNGCPEGVVNTHIASLKFTTSNSDLPNHSHVYWYVTNGQNFLYASTIDEWFDITPMNTYMEVNSINIGYTLQGGENIVVHLVVGAPYQPE